MFENEINSYKDNIISDLTCLMNIDTTIDKKKPNMPFGEGIYRGLRFMLDKGESFGFYHQNYCGYCGQLQAGSGSYTVGVVCGLDTEKKGNTRIENDIIYGEGALRGKGAMIAVLYAMKILKDKDLIPPDKRIRMVILEDHLSGTRSINYYKEYEQPPEIGFTPDGAFPVIYGEKGTVYLKLRMHTPSNYDAPINIVEITGGDDIHKVPSKANIILSCEDIFKSRVEEELKSYSEISGIEYNIFSQNKLINIEIVGKTARGSEPEKGINAISHALKFLSRLNEFIDRREFIEEYEKLISTTFNGEKIGCIYSDKDSGKFTFNVGKILLMNDNVEIEVDIRFPISVVYSDVFERLRESFKYSPLKIEDISHIRPVSFMPDSFVIKKLEKAYREVTNDNETKPYVTDGTSYAREMSNTVCFGPENSQFNTCKLDEECISEGYLMQLVEIYARGLYELLN